MNKVINDVYLKLILNVLRNYMNSIFTWNNKCKNAKKFVANFHNKTEYPIHIRNLNMH